MRRFTFLALITTIGAACSSAPPPVPIVLQSCQAATGEPARCGSVSVFENRMTRTGRKIDVHFTVLRAETPGASGQNEALFLFAGGPGDDGANIIGLASGWMRPVRGRMDVVVMDQRGTGRSNALDCPRDIEDDPAATFGAMYPDAWVKSCRTTLSKHAELNMYSTAAAAEDVDEIRRALGYARISLYGGSYGTQLAQAYMRRFPDRVKGAVLDGVAPVDTPLPLTYAASAQRALDLVFEECAARPECRRSHPRLAADFQALLQRFDRGPVPATVRTASGAEVPVSMSRGDFGYAIRGVMYGPNGIAILPALISRAAATGNLSPFAQRYFERQVRFNRGFAIGLHWSILCGEDIAVVRDDEIAPATAKTFLGRYVIDEYRRACSQWTPAAVIDGYRNPVKSLVPTLLVSGRFDPVTPPSFGESVARALPVARHVIVPDGSHGSAGQCPRDAALHVLMNGTLEGMPAVCKEKLLPSAL
jgi:pimeloyl-ACP methyl ester carboxylesterase